MPSAEHFTGAARVRVEELESALQKQKQDLMQALQHQRSKGDSALVEAQEASDLALIAAVRKQKDTDDAVLNKTREQAAKDMAKALREQQEAHDAELAKVRAEAAAAAAAAQKEKELLQATLADNIATIALLEENIRKINTDHEADVARRRAHGDMVTNALAAKEATNVKELAAAREQAARQKTALEDELSATKRDAAAALASEQHRLKMEHAAEIEKARAREEQLKDALVLANAGAR